MRESIATAFTDRFAAAVERAVVGDPMRDVLLGPLMDARFAASFDEHLCRIGDHHTVRGSTGIGRITGENTREGFGGDAAAGLYDHPTIVEGVRPDDRLFRHETFGPIVGVTTYGHLEEVIELWNLPGYGLSAAICSDERQTVFTYRRGVRAEMVSVNNSTSGAQVHLSFGGNERSGKGSRQSGVRVLDQLTRWQAVNWGYSGALAPQDAATPD